MFLNTGRFWKLTLVTTVAAVLTLLRPATTVAEDDQVEKSVAVQLSELPDHIRQAAMKAVRGGDIIAASHEVEGEDPGQYDVMIRLDDKVYAVEITPDGDVLEVKDIATDEVVPRGDQTKKWTDTFHTENCTFLTTGRNRFFILEPGYQLVLESPHEKLTVTVLDETKKIGDVMTRVVEEREEKRGVLAEVSRNFYAICKEHGDVYYFGEEVDIYKEGKVVRHEGAWRADEKHSKAGIAMPGTILLGARYYQEIAPNARDKAEHVRDDVTLETPAGRFENCLAVEETSDVEGGKEYKFYAPGVGVIQDEGLRLTHYGPSKPKQ